MPHDIHLVTGVTGAGKSTYSAQLAHDLRGVRFSIDEWMETLHNADKPDELRFEWFYERVQRNCLMMRRMAEQVVGVGRPCVFDCGFTNAQERAIFADWADEMGYSTRLHWIATPVEAAWRRVEHRNREKGETFQFDVTREMFDFILSIWEEPGDEEMARMNGLKVT